MDTITNPPNLFFSKNTAPMTTTILEKEIFLTTVMGQPVHYTIRAYPNQRTETKLHHPPRHGAVTFQTNRTFSYQPQPSFTGMDTFSCLLQNERGQMIVIPFSTIVNIKEKKPIKKGECGNYIHPYYWEVYHLRRQKINEGYSFI